MIKYLGLLLFACVQVFGRPNEGVETHVVGGTPVEEGVFPFAVSLRNTSKAFFCGGSIISDQFVMTACHCVNPNATNTGEPDKVLVGVGSVHLNKQTLVEVEKIILHPHCGKGNNFNDIAILKLKNQLTFSETVQPVDYTYTKNLDYLVVSAMGWGKTKLNGPKSEVLLHLNHTILSQQECNEIFSSNVGPGDLCLAGSKGKGMCMGDSGSPLYLVDEGKGYVVGVMSRAIPCATGAPDIFVRVSYYLRWIQKTLSEN